MRGVEPYKTLALPLALILPTNRTFTIRFFANPVFSPAGYEGKRYLGQKSVTTDENGDVSFTRQIAIAVRAGQVITATGPGGNASEFSGPRRVVQ